MNKMTKLAAAIALASGALTTAPAMADVSATAGFVTDYYFRGVKLGDAAAYGSVDYSAGGFYAGIWAIDYGTSDDDGDAVEYDLYAGYAFEFENGISVDLGIIQYEYTDSTDSETDLSLTVGFGDFSVNYTDVSDDNPDDDDYDAKVYSISWSGEVFGATYGHVDTDETSSGANDEEEYDWIELTASGEVVGLDVTLAIGTTENVESSGEDDAGSDGYILLDVSKSFDL
jgi:uncharacterized protein (TIGR02001 family)